MTSIIDSLTTGKPILIRQDRDNPLEVKILSNEVYSRSNKIKTKVHPIIGDDDIYEFIGLGEKRIKIQFYFDNEDDFNNLSDFVSNGDPFLIVCKFFPLEPLKIDGDITLEPYYSGFGTATINFTTAVKDFDDKQNLLSYYSSLAAQSTAETVSNKKNFLEKLNSWAEKTFETVSKGNQYVGNVTNNISAYSAAFTNVLSGISSGASIITNPISSIKTSISDVTSGLSSVISSLQNVVLTIKQIPTDVKTIIDSFSIIGDKLNNLFDLGNSNDSLKYNTDFLTRVSTSIMNIDLSQDNDSIINDYDKNTSSTNEFSSTEYFLPALNKKTNDVMNVLLLCSILINLYENSSKINRWNTIDLENLRSRTETLYNYISTFELDTELSLELDLARNRFFKIFKILWDRAYNIVEFEITEPNFLENLVYSVNGNLDFYDENKKLNNAIGGIVHPGIVRIISND
jgi:hypothetical protein